ncbi:hypothetical protein ACFOLF_01205 [Paenibacillus sepulcri]|uniref:Uncharacterized protein n=1 Tax=Paenibacillus sepulcri TaxID=359917 RepID=A0ABS7C9G9_9BACL|nr:hypothetical protein [Paenibacillus sepulcri]
MIICRFLIRMTNSGVKSAAGEDFNNNIYSRELEAQLGVKVANSRTG